MKDVGWAKLIFFIFLASVSAMCGTWVADRGEATDTQSATPIEGVVAAGDVLRISYRYRRYRLCPRQIERQILDGQGVRFELGAQQRAVPGPLGSDSYTQLVQIPVTAAPGKARYRATILDYCNPIHRLFPLRKDIEVPFMIVPAEIPSSMIP